MAFGGSNLTVKIGADLSDLNRGLAEGERNIRTFGAGMSSNITAPLRTVTTEAGRSHAGLGKLRQELLTVTRAATGLHPVLGQVGGMLGEMALGGPLLIGVLGGITALSFGWSKLTEDSRKFKEETKAAIAELEKLRDRQALGPLAGTSARAAEKAGVRLEEVQSEIDTVRGFTAKKGPQFEALRQGAAIRLAELLEEQKNLRSLIQAHENEVTRIRAEKAKEREEIAKREHQEATKGIRAERAEWDRFFDTLRKKNAELNIAASKLPTDLPTPTRRTLPHVVSLDTSIGSVRGADTLTTVLPTEMSKVQQAMRAGFAEVSVAIGQTLAQNLGRIFGGGRGAQIGGSIAGAGLGAAFGKLGGGVIGAAVLPVVGSVLGTFVGSAIGSLFDHKKKVDQSATAFDRLARTTERVNAAIAGLPAGYKIDPARYKATAGVQEVTPPGQLPPPPPPGSTGFFDRSAGGGAVYIGTLNLPNVRDSVDFIREIGSIAQDAQARGGTSGLTLAAAF